MKRSLNNINVTLFFRKRHSIGSFSIENSFEQMIRHFPEKTGFIINSYEINSFSNGILPRIRAAIDAYRHRSDINHVTGDIHFITLALPSNNTVLTIHDCGFMRHPSPIARKILKWIWLDLPVKHCRYVTSVSEATRQEIIHYTNCDPEKIIVIHTIISNVFKRTDKSFNSRHPRILHIGMAQNKNFSRHIEALSGIDCELYIIGKLESHHIALLNDNGIKYTAQFNLNQNDIVRAYVDCDILLFSSTLEGFGMPIIEAQSTGRAVITSNISSMPEIAGDGACLVDPFSVESIRQGLQHVISDNEYRNSIIAAGFNNARRFSPEHVAKQYEELYQRLINCE